MVLAQQAFILVLFFNREIDFGLSKKILHFPFETEDQALEVVDYVIPLSPIRFILYQICYQNMDSSHF
jgi:hypothetical protein